MASPSRIGEDINPTHTLSNFLRSRYTIITASANKIKKIANKSNGRNKLSIHYPLSSMPKDGSSARALRILLQPTTLPSAGSSKSSFELSTSAYIPSPSPIRIATVHAIRARVDGGGTLVLGGLYGSSIGLSTAMRAPKSVD